MWFGASIVLCFPRRRCLPLIGVARDHKLVRTNWSLSAVSPLVLQRKSLNLYGHCPTSVVSLSVVLSTPMRLTSHTPRLPGSHNLRRRRRLSHLPHVLRRWSAAFSPCSVQTTGTTDQLNYWLYWRYWLSWWRALVGYTWLRLCHYANTHADTQYAPSHTYSLQGAPRKLFAPVHSSLTLLCAHATVILLRRPRLRLSYPHMLVYHVTVLSRKISVSNSRLTQAVCAMVCYALVYIHQGITVSSVVYVCLLTPQLTRKAQVGHQKYF